jgi:predicted N-acetyltransferase YhbS
MRISTPAAQPRGPSYLTPEYEGNLHYRERRKEYFLTSGNSFPPGFTDMVMDNSITIRSELPEDYAAIKTLNDLAFGQPNEGTLVEKLRLNPYYIKELSLVAVVNSTVIGHILFFPIKIRSNSEAHASLALAPMAVLPDQQKKGIGGKLVRQGLKVAKQLGFKSVIVVGHKDYYPRFGFAPASKWRIRPPFDVPDASFLAISLRKDGLKSVSGVVEYPEEFNQVG